MVKRNRTKKCEGGNCCDSQNFALDLDDGITAHPSSADPYEPDQPTDAIRVMTQRQLNRIIFVAAEAGARFNSRDSSQATSWMFAPWPQFDGRPAHFACFDREKFLHAIWLHRSAAPLLIKPEQFDASPDGHAPMGRTHNKAAAVQLCGRRASLADLGLGTADLFTATIVEENVRGHLHIFAAFLAVDEQEARDRLEIRVGASLTSAATICRGFDPSEPIAASLLSDAVVHTLSDIAQEPTSSLAAGLDLLVEHRFAV